MSASVLFQIKEMPDPAQKQTRHCECQRSNPWASKNGSLRRGACHRARIRATRWLPCANAPRLSQAMTKIGRTGMDASTPKDLHYYEPRNGHGLKHDPFNAIIAPRPIGWISSRDAKGNLNLAPYSFFNGFCYK